MHVRGKFGFCKLFPFFFLPPGLWMPPIGGLFMRWVACTVAGLAFLVGGCIVTAEQERVRDYNQDGVFLFQHGDFVGARDSFQAATALKPEDPAIMYNRGECQERLGNLPKAECYYRE